MAGELFGRRPYCRTYNVIFLEALLYAVATRYSNDTLKTGTLVREWLVKPKAQALRFGKQRILAEKWTTLKGWVCIMSAHF